MSGQYLFNIMGKNTQANPMTMKNDIGFVSSLYGTGVSLNSRNALFQNSNRIKGMVNSPSNNLNYESISISDDSSFTITTSTLLKITNTNLEIGNGNGNGNDIKIIINGIKIFIKANTTKIVLYENNNIIEIK
jgi:hypothetical protein